MLYFSFRFFPGLIVGLLLVVVPLCGGCDLLSGDDSDSSTPEVVWTHDLEHDEVDNTQPLLLDGIAYVAADHHLFAFDAESGEVLWHSYPPEFSKDRSFTYLSPLGVGDDYMVNVGSQKIYGLSRP